DTFVTFSYIAARNAPARPGLSITEPPMSGGHEAVKPSGGSKMNKLIMSTLVAAGFAAAVPLAIAQANPPAAGQGQHAQRGHHGKQAFRMPGERVEARLAYMKTALKITEAQQPQWDAFAGVMRKQAKEADA